MQHFVDDDAGYARWLAGHPEGFALNSYRSPSTAYLMLHSAGCAGTDLLGMDDTPPRV